MKGKILFAKYELIRELGQGASGQVYLVRDTRLKQYWAMKKIPKEKGESFMEVRVLKNLNHPDLPRIVDCMETTDDVYLVIDYMEGVNLQSVLNQGKRFDAHYILKWGIQLCHIFEYLHGQNPPIIYCDLKPSNLILTPDYQLKLIDFGIALEGRKKQMFGTKGFAPPEQYKENVVVDERSDIYSLGKTLACLGDVKGHKGLNKILERCMKEEPRKRYQDAGAVKRALYRCQGNVVCKIAGVPKKIQRLSIFCVLLLCLFMGMLWKGERHEKQYETYLNQGVQLEAKGEKDTFQKQVVTLYEKAIEQDSKKADAYLYLLHYFVQRNRKKEGVHLLVQYVESDRYHARECDEVLFTLGKLYMQGDDRNDDFPPDYELAKKYLSMEEKPSKEGKLWKELVAFLSQSGGEIPWETVNEILLTLGDETKEFDTTYTILSVYEEQEENLKEFQTSNQMKQRLIEKMKRYLSTNLDKKFYQETILKREIMKVYQGSKNWKQYVEDYVTMLSTPKEKQETWLKAAKYYEKTKQQGLADKLYQKAIAVNSKEVDGYICYGLFLYQTGDVNGARKMYQMAKKYGGKDLYEQKLLEKKLGGNYESNEVDRR